MKLYHATNHVAASRILEEGFRDGTGTYLTENEYTGVWLSDVPEFYEQGAEALLEVELDIDVDTIVEHEWVNQGLMTYREFLVPAAIGNAHSSVRLVSDEEFRERDEQGEWERF